MLRNSFWRILLCCKWFLSFLLHEFQCSESGRVCNDKYVNDADKRPDVPRTRLAMNYNGYIIISIIIGAYLGSFLFSWESLSQNSGSNTSAGEEATVCCS